MLEVFVDERGELAIENMEELLKDFPEHADRAVASGLKSEGYRLKGLIQSAIKSGGPQSSWDSLNPHTGVMSRAKKGYIKNFKMVWRGKKGNKKRIRQYKDIILSTRKNPLTKLAGAVRYQYDDELKTVDIGFIQSEGVSPGMLKLARKHAQGETTRITPKMRKFLFAIGFPVKGSTTQLKTPARPVIDPIFEQEQNNITANLEIKFLKALDRYFKEGK